jgi:hypothetical protein
MKKFFYLQEEIKIKRITKLLNEFLYYSMCVVYDKMKTWALIAHQTNKQTKTIEINIM